MSTPRRKIRESLQAEVLVQCRRRCCVCFGLKRDDNVKKGQIAHIDQRRSNDALENLVWLCLDHHDEFDSTTSQAKGLTRAEVSRYKAELLAHYSSWQSSSSTNELLSFLAFQVDVDAMANAAIVAARQTTCFGESHAFEVLITDAVDYSDSDLYIPYVLALDFYASWGWLTYTYEEREIPDHDESPRVFLTVSRKQTCDAVAARILERSRDRPEDHDRLMHIASHVNWKPNPEALPKPRFSG